MHERTSPYTTTVPPPDELTSPETSPCTTMNARSSRAPAAIEFANVEIICRRVEGHILGNVGMTNEESQP
jgi:hypothetical protein